MQGRPRPVGLARGDRAGDPVSEGSGARRARRGSRAGIRRRPRARRATAGAAMRAAERPEAERQTITFGDLKVGDYMTAETGEHARWVEVTAIRKDKAAPG